MWLAQITDPYRWLEDADAEDTKQFVDAQNAVTVPFLEKCPLRTKLHDRCRDAFSDTCLVFTCGSCHSY